MFNFAKFLLETKNEFNGHKQTEINGLTVNDIDRLIGDLEFETGSSFITYFDEDEYHIYQLDFWEEGDECPVKLHRLILSGTCFKENSMEYTQNEAIIDQRICIENAIAGYKKQLEQLQESCPHINLQSVNKSDTGNYDPSADCYWKEHKCHSCGKFWTEDV